MRGHHAFVGPRFLARMFLAFSPAERWRWMGTMRLWGRGSWLECSLLFRPPRDGD